MYDTAILIGRFEPVHTGHVALLREALSRAQRAIVVVGSAHQPRSPRNPFTWQEREAMLRGALPGLRVVLVTGYAELHPQKSPNLPRLHKPFQQEQLAAAVAELTEASREPAPELQFVNR
mgnify:CR=1 FL=1